MTKEAECRCCTEHISALHFGREKVEELDFVRTICAIGIILHHVSCYVSPDAPKILYTYANGWFGALFVNVFFIISGGVLYHNYSETGKLTVFYYKRWKSIFPMFYITYLFFYIRNVVISNNFFYNGKPWTLLLSVFGLDGYFAYRIPGYYIIGEWFLGAIVLLYVLYPFFAKLIKILDWKILLVALPLIICQFESDWFIIHPYHTLIYCGAMFLVGMLVFRYRLYRNMYIKLAGCVLGIIDLVMPIPGMGLYEGFAAIPVFFALFALGGLVLQIPVLRNVVTFLSGLSFPMFLVQNKVIGFLTSNIPVYSYFDLIKVMALAVFLSILCAWCIKSLTNGIMHTKWFLHFDKKIMAMNSRGD